VQTQRQQHDVGHEGVITGRDALSLRSSITDPQGVAQPPLQSWHMFLLLMSSLNLGHKQNKFPIKSYFLDFFPLIDSILMKKVIV